MMWRVHLARVDLLLRFHKAFISKISTPFGRQADQPMQVPVQIGLAGTEAAVVAVMINHAELARKQSWRLEPVAPEDWTSIGLRLLDTNR